LENGKRRIKKEKGLKRKRRLDSSRWEKVVGSRRKKYNVLSLHKEIKAQA